MVVSVGHFVLISCSCGCYSGRRLQFMRRFRRFGLIAFIALLVILPLHEVVDPGEQWPFDDEVVSVLFSALFIAAALLTCHVWGRELFVLVRAAARRRLGLNKTVTQTAVSAVAPPRDESLAHLVLCQFRI